MLGEAPEARMVSGTQAHNAPSLVPLLIIGVVSIFLIYAGFTVGLFWFHSSMDVQLSEKQAKAISVTGQFGDSFGMMNAAFSGLAFVALIVSLILQRKDLQASLTELHVASDAQQKIK